MKPFYASRLLVFVALFIFSFQSFADDHGNTFGTATVVNIGSKTNGSLEISGDSDYFRFAVVQTAKYVLYSRGNADIEGQLFNEFFDGITTDRDDGELDNFRIEITLSPGTYYLVVQADFGGSATGTYSFFVEGPSAGIVTDDHGSSIWSATTMSVGSKRNGALQLAGDKDFFRFQVIQTAKYVLYSRDSVDIEGTLYDSAYQEIRSDTDDGELDNFRIERIIAPGTYYLEVQADFGGSTTGNYSVFIEGPGAGIITDDHGSSIWSATTMSVGSSRNGVLQLAGDKDFFRFQVIQTAKYVLYSRNSVDIEGALYDSAYEEITSDTDDGELDNFRIERILSPGTYYLEVQADFGGSTTGNYSVFIEGPGAGIVTDDHGSSIWSGTTIFPYCEVVGTLEPAGDKDFFRFLVSGSTMFVVIRSTGQIDIEGTLYDDSYDEIESDRDSGGSFGNFQIDRDLSPGTYYLEVQADFGGTITGNYQLVVEAGSLGRCKFIFSDDFEN